MRFLWQWSPAIGCTPWLRRIWKDQCSSKTLLPVTRLFTPVAHPFWATGEKSTGFCPAASRVGSLSLHWADNLSASANETVPGSCPGTELHSQQIMVSFLHNFWVFGFTRVDFTEKPRFSASLGTTGILTGRDSGVTWSRTVPDSRWGQPQKELWRFVWLSLQILPGPVPVLHCPIPGGVFLTSYLAFPGCKLWPLPLLMSIGIAKINFALSSLYLHFK